MFRAVATATAWPWYDDLIIQTRQNSAGWGEFARFSYNGGLGLWTTSFAGGVRVIAIGDCSSAPSGSPVAGGVLYSQGGALTWKGSSGTVTTIAAA
jgi:hypothetical protein